MANFFWLLSAFTLFVALVAFAAYRRSTQGNLPFWLCKIIRHPFLVQPKGQSSVLICRGCAAVYDGFCFVPRKGNA